MLNMAVEEIAKACASTALILMIQELGTLPIRLFGSDELKQRFLPRCASGEWSPAFALSEPDAGSDPGGMLTKAVQDGDEWVINGTKNWITNLGIADFYVVFAVTDRRRVTRAGSPRSWSRQTGPASASASSSTSSGSAARRPGSRSSTRCGCPQENVDRRGQPRLQGRDGDARPLAAGSRGAGARHRPGRDRLRGRLRAGAQAVRTADQLLPGDPVQARRHGDPMRRGARAALPGVREDRPRRRRRRQVLGDGQAVLLRRGDAVTVEAVQVLGGYGYVKEYPVERMLRDAKITQIYEGTNEIQRLVIARTMR